MPLRSESRAEAEVQHSGAETLQPTKWLKRLVSDPHAEEEDACDECSRCGTW